MIDDFARRQILRAALNYKADIERFQREADATRGDESRVARIAEIRAREKLNAVLDLADDLDAGTVDLGDDPRVVTPQGYSVYEDEL